MCVCERERDSYQSLYDCMLQGAIKTRHTHARIGVFLVLVKCNTILHHHHHQQFIACFKNYDNVTSQQAGCATHTHTRTQTYTLTTAGRTFELCVTQFMSHSLVH